MKNMIDVKVTFFGKDNNGEYKNDWTFKVSKSMADKIESGDREDFCGYVVSTLMRVANRKFDTMFTKSFISDRDTYILDSYDRGTINFNDVSYFSK